MIEILSLIAGLMTTAAPIAQALKTIRSRDVAGLSSTSYLLLLCLGSFAVLIGIQYRIVSMTLLNVLGLAAGMVVMFFISKRLLATFAATLIGLAILATAIAPWFIPTLLTTKWAEQVAFIYGLLAAATFLPQVVFTHRTRVVSSLSTANLVLFAGGLSLFIGVSVMLANYSLILWNSVLVLMILELLRLKLTIERKHSAASSSDGMALAANHVHSSNRTSVRAIAGSAAAKLGD